MAELAIYALYRMLNKAPDLSLLNNSKTYESSIAQLHQPKTIDFFAVNDPPRIIKNFSPRDQEFWEYLKKPYIPKEKDFIDQIVSKGEIGYIAYRYNQKTGTTTYIPVIIKGQMLFRFYRSEKSEENFDLVTMSIRWKKEKGEIKPLDNPAVYFLLESNNVWIYFNTPSCGGKPECIDQITLDTTGKCKERLLIKYNEAKKQKGPEKKKKIPKIIAQVQNHPPVRFSRQSFYRTQNRI